MEKSSEYDPSETITNTAKTQAETSTNYFRLTTKPR